MSKKLPAKLRQLSFKLLYDLLPKVTAVGPTLIFCPLCRGHVPSTLQHTFVSCPALKGSKQAVQVILALLEPGASFDMSFLRYNGASVERSP
mgnify:CR=1 FL=1